jgi:hypothetical protein
MLNVDWFEFTSTIMPGSESAYSGRRILLEQLERIGDAPVRSRFLGEVLNPAIHLSQPIGRILVLHIGDHASNVMDGAMMAKLETLYASRRAGCSRYVFPLIPPLLLWGWQTFALDWQEGIELSMPAAFDDKECPTRLWCEVDGSSTPGFVRNFSAELDAAPTG